MTLPVSSSIPTGLLLVLPDGTAIDARTVYLIKTEPPREAVSLGAGKEIPALPWRVLMRLSATRPHGTGATDSLIFPCGSETEANQLRDLLIRKVNH